MILGDLNQGDAAWPLFADDIEGLGAAGGTQDGGSRGPAAANAVELEV